MHDNQLPNILRNKVACKLYATRHHLALSRIKTRKIKVLVTKAFGYLEYSRRRLCLSVSWQEWCEGGRKKFYSLVRHKLAQIVLHTLFVQVATKSNALSYCRYHQGSKHVNISVLGLKTSQLRHFADCVVS